MGEQKGPVVTGTKKELVKETCGLLQLEEGREKENKLSVEIETGHQVFKSGGILKSHLVSGSKVKSSIGHGTLNLHDKRVFFGGLRSITINP